MSQYETGMAHERMRFSSMNGRQLLTRLNRITHRDKLEKFIVLAREFGYDNLVSLANRKLYEMDTLSTMPELKADVINKAIVEVMGKAVVKEVELKRPVRRFDLD